MVGTGDFDGDGDSDILLRNNDFPGPEGSGAGRPTTVLFLQDGAVASQANWGFSPVGGGVKGIADFDGDGTSDVLWRDENGRLKLWYWGVSGNVDVSWRNEAGAVGTGPEWDVKAVGDFDGDGYPDIAWRHDNGQVVIWLMVGSIYRFEVWPGGTNFGLDWRSRVSVISMPTVDPTCCGGIATAAWRSGSKAPTSARRTRRGAIKAVRPI